MDRRLPLHDFLRILRSFGVEVDVAGGKGSHIKLVQRRSEGRFTYPIPSAKEVERCYVRGARKRFLLDEANGVTDDDFYGR